MKTKRIIIMGAGGRDFHNFNTVFRDNPQYEVAAFTAAQIPFTGGRIYPPSLAGESYPDGIPIHPEEKLKPLIKTLRPDAVVFAYSDVPHEEVMHKASLVLSLGPDFHLMGPESTMLTSDLPVISVCAVRTGCGKSPLTRRLMGMLRKLGRRPVAIRHPMAYCNLEAQVCQRFASTSDIDGQICTIEEREEYEGLVDEGFTVFSGVDYARVLRAAEAEADVIVWDGGNNDFPFIKPDVEIVVADALRPGHCLTYHPGETNLRRADVVVVNKVSEETLEGLKKIKRSVKDVNPKAKVIAARSPVRIFPASPGTAFPLKGKRVLVVEDGPTLTHGGMSFGAGAEAARQAGARIVSPVPYAKGSIRDAFKAYGHLRDVLPAMGYSPSQLRDLAKTINAVPCDAVILATPVNLTRLINIKKPAFRVTYSIKETGGALTKIVREFLEKT